MRVLALLLMALNWTGIPNIILDGTYTRDETFTYNKQQSYNEGRGWHRIFYVSGNLYSVVAIAGSPTWTIEILKSTDSGRFWDIVDAGGPAMESVAPLRNGPLFSFDAVLIGSTIHVFYDRNADATLAHQSFSTSSDTWSGTETSSSATPVRAYLNTAATPTSTVRWGNSAMIMAEKQDSGEVRVFWNEFESISSVNYIRIKTARFDPSGPSWSTPITLVDSGATNHDQVCQILQDAGNARTHVFYMQWDTATTRPTSTSEVRYRHVSVDDDDTLNAASTIATDGAFGNAWTGNLGLPAIISDVLMVPYVSGTWITSGRYGTGTQALKLLYGSNAAEPTFSTETVPTTYEPYAGTSTVGVEEHPAMVIQRGSKVEVWYSSQYANNTSDTPSEIGLYDSPNALLKIIRNGAGDWAEERPIAVSDGAVDTFDTNTQNTPGITAMGPIPSQPETGLGVAWMDYHAETTYWGYTWYFVYSPEQDSTTTTNVLGVSY